MIILFDKIFLRLIIFGLTRGHNTDAPSKEIAIFYDIEGILLGDLARRIFRAFDIFEEGNIAEGTTRLLTQAIGTIPSIAQAMIPYVGIPSIVAGSAAEASREAVYDEGKDITLKQNL